jgi:hypothetical protein
LTLRRCLPDLDFDSAYAICHLVIQPSSYKGADEAESSIKDRKNNERGDAETSETRDLTSTSVGSRYHGKQGKNRTEKSSEESVNDTRDFGKRNGIHSLDDHGDVDLLRRYTLTQPAMQEGRPTARQTVRARVATTQLGAGRRGES